MSSTISQPGTFQLRAFVFTSVIAVVFISLLAFITLYNPAAATAMPHEGEIILDPAMLAPLSDNTVSEASGAAENKKPLKQEAAPLNPVQKNEQHPLSEEALFPGMSSHENNNGNNARTLPGNENTQGNHSPGIYDNAGTDATHVLDGRSCIYKPAMQSAVGEEGLVVVNVWVDETGRVTRTSINEQQTNTSNAALRKMALNASAKTKWTEKNGIPEQKGRIAYKFVLR